MKNINLIVLALFSLVLVSCGSSSSGSSTPTTATNNGGFSLAEDSLTFELTEGETKDLTITITSNEAVATTDLDNVSFTATFNISYGTATATDFSTTDITREVTGDVTIESDSSTNTATIDIAVNTAVLEILADNILEDDETFVLRLTTLEVSHDLLDNIPINPANNTITITIENDDKVELLIADAVADEAEDLIFTVTVSGVSEIAIPFGYEVTAAGDKPVAADDFIGGAFPSGTDSITIGDPTTTINIAINDDDSAEEQETFAISLSSTNEFVITDATAEGTIKDNDFRGFSLAEDSLTFELTEGATEDLPITITSNEAVAATDLDNVSFTATFNLSYGTATASDFSTTADTREVTGDVTIESDSNTSTATLTINTAVLEILADDILEAAETFVLRLTALEVDSDLLTTAILINPANNRITITIENDDKVELLIADASANEAENLIFTVTVSGVSEIAIPFSYVVTASGDNSAAADDFIGDAFPSDTVSIAIGDPTTTINIAINDDDFAENQETFALSLSSDNTDVIVNTATGTIGDNDRANLTISGGGDIIEGGVSSVFVVTIDKATQIELTATYTVEGTGDNPATATDFTTGETTKTVTFPANSTAGTTQTFTLETVDNDVISDNKEFFLQFSTNENSLTGDNSANFVIFDDDNNGAIILANQTVVEGDTIDLEFVVNPSAFNGGVTTVTITYEIELAGSVPATIEDFTNFDATGTVELTMAVPQQTITVATAADEIIETDQSFSVVITETTPVSVLENTLINNRSRAITIIDNNEANLVLGRDSGNEIAEGEADSTTAATFTVSLASEQTTEIDLDFTITAEGTGDNPTTATDFGGTFPTKPITITAGNATTNFSISVAGDAALEDDEQFIFTASGANFGSLVISGDVFTIKNDDRVTLSVSAVATSVNEADGSANFTLSVTTGESAIAIPFRYSVTATGDKPVDADDFGGAFPSNTDSIAIDATTTTINIAINNDDELEETESFLFSLTASDNELLNSFIDFGTPTATVDIENDDRVTLSITPSTLSVREDAGSVDFTVALVGNFASPISFSYSVSATGSKPVAADDFGGGAFLSGTDSLTIGDTIIISIAIDDDNVLELAETFLFSLAASGDAATFPNSFIDFDTATGTIENDDFNITTAVGFNSIRNNLAIDYQLLNDLDLSEFPNFEPFGEFTAIFDGNGYTIRGFTVTVFSAGTNAGLFTTLNGATIRNLIIENPQINTVGVSSYGVLAGQAINSIIDNVGVSSDSSVSLSIDGGNARLGGLVGRIDTSTINNSWATGSIAGFSQVGGLVGLVTGNSTISNSWAAVGVVGSTNIGGEDDVGGLVGLITGNSTISDSWASGSVDGNRDDVGGLVGRNEDSMISNSWASGSVVGIRDYVGGLVGRSNEDSMINNSWASGSVVGDNEVGGLVGDNSGSTINNSWASGSVVGNNEVGGLVGDNSGSTINNSWASGSVSGSGDNVGGLVGRSNSSSSIISNSWASGSVVGIRYVGGLVGNNSTGPTINNSWASGSVVGDTNIGGLVGQNRFTAKINNSWASGSVVGNTEIGGLVGGGNPNATVSNSYWNTETSGQTISFGSTTTFGVTTAEMIEATGTAGETAFDNWNTIANMPWSFEATDEYPTISSNATADFQLVSQVAGQLRLIPAADTNGTGTVFFGDSNIQDELSVTATDFTANSTLAIFDLNARAGNTDNTRADFSTCTIATPATVGDTLLTTTGVNDTTVAVIITADTTNTDWTATEACEIEVGTQPTIGDELNLTVEITKGDETATRQFKITFE